MKRRQIVIDHIEDMDNHLLAAERALTIPNVSKEAIANYINMARERLKIIENFIKLEDNG